MKNLKNFKHEKEFDTKTLISDTIESLRDTEPGSSDTREAVTLKELAQSRAEDADGKETLLYEPRPLTPDDDIYDEIIEQFATAPTKPKYWFEEFGDYWSCSCGHINKGDSCKNCGLERDLLRSLFILHKPAGEPGKLNKKLKSEKEKVDKEEKLHADKAERRRKREAESGSELEVVPIEDSPESNKLPAPVSEKTSEPQIPAEIQNVPVKPHKPHRRAIILVTILVLIAMVTAAGAAIYVYLAAPAIKYEEALELQKNGKYSEAIKKFTALGDYQDCDEHIWECYVSIGDDYYDDGRFEDAIDTYNTAMDLKESDKLYDKIRKCHIAIGDKYYKNKKYKKALAAYASAAEMKESNSLQEKINAAKFGYVKVNLDDGSSTALKYMNELMDISYPGIQEIYDEYYEWHVSIIANTTEEDYSTDLDTVSRKDTVFFHVLLSGGEPSEEIQLYYEISWPNGQSQIYDLDSTWKDGSKITAGFQYPIPLFGKEGQLTFNLYDKNTQELLGSDSITFRK